MSRPPSYNTSNMALMIWLRTRSFRERRGREETMQSTCRSLGRQPPSQQASASRTVRCGKRSRNRLAITGDCSTTTKRRGAMPASSNCRVTVPVPAPPAHHPCGERRRPCSGQGAYRLGIPCQHSAANVPMPGRTPKRCPSTGETTEKPESEKTCSKPLAVSSHGIYETPAIQASSMISARSKRIREPPCGMPCSRGRISASSAP